MPPRTPTDHRDEQRPAHGIIGSSPLLLQALAYVKRMAITGLAILLIGETGTGKELLARYAHDMSPRADGPYVPVDCTRLKGDLADSMLFGHVRGSFTTAVRDRGGLVAKAHGGTLFLDEVAKLTLDGQAMLLRLIDQGTYSKVGSDAEERANVRIVAASNQDLKAMVERGEFHRDLYYRLQRFEIEIPPLRARRQDVPQIARDFIALNRDIELLGRKPLSLEAERVLRSYDWPGNVRELQNALCRATLLAEGESISGDDMARGIDGVVESHVVRLCMVMLTGEGRAHLTTLVGITSVSESTVRRELDRLMQTRGIRTGVVDGRRVYYAPGPVLGEIQSLGCEEQGSSGVGDGPTVGNDPAPPVSAAPAQDEEDAPKSMSTAAKEQAALDIARREGRVTRAMLVDATDMPKDTASKVLRRLVKRGLLVKEGGTGCGVGYVLAG